MRITDINHPLNLRAIWHLVQAYQRVIAAYRQTDQLPAGTVIRIVPKQDHAPQSLPALVEWVDQFKALPIAAEHGERSIYGGDLANAVFRAFHDAGHYVHRKEMEFADEVLLAGMQWAELVPELQELGADLQRCRVLYFADTVGQSVYCERAGRFPSDQVAFVEMIVTAAWLAADDQDSLLHVVTCAAQRLADRDPEL